jgi:hypothetical protein
MVGTTLTDGSLIGLGIRSILRVSTVGFDGIEAEASVDLRNVAKETLDPVGAGSSNRLWAAAPATV